MTDTAVNWEHNPNRRLPDALVMQAPALSALEARIVARDAVEFARRVAPKLSGASSRRLVAYHGAGFFGIRWVDNHVWFQEMGVRAFTMRNLAGKTIPMWIDDPSGKERRKNPRARVRTTASGKTQVLIFRRAARIGERTQKVNPRTGQIRWVPRSYPGAPGRIGSREAGQPLTTVGRQPGGVARGNVGVRWRFPGLDPRHFLQHGMMEAAFRHGIPPNPVMAVNSTRFVVRDRRAS